MKIICKLTSYFSSIKNEWLHWSEYVKQALALFIPSAGMFVRSCGFKEMVLENILDE